MSLATAGFSATTATLPRTLVPGSVTTASSIRIVSSPVPGRPEKSPSMVIDGKDSGSHTSSTPRNDCAAPTAHGARCPRTTAPGSSLGAAGHHLRRLGEIARLHVPEVGVDASPRHQLVVAPLLRHP